ncbi:MAG: bifunctional class I SAM-dependent methyltransferase/glycosyltransferase family 2 protein [Candidatus Omnitrophota bacterium]
MKSLAFKLLERENQRMVYWKDFDPFIKLRMGWRASMMRHLFHILPGQRILEIGAGDGSFTKALNIATRGECEITAVVFSRERRDEMKKKFTDKNIKVIYLDSFSDLPREEKFDYITAHHTLDNETYDTFLRGIKPLIKQGGCFLLFEPNPWNPYYRARKLIQRLLPRQWKRPATTVLLNRLQVFSVLSKTGYTDINVLPYDFLYPPIPKFLLWPVQHLSLIMENCPYLRNFAGDLCIWARNPAPEDYLQPSRDFSEHEMFFGKVSFVVPCHNEEMNVLPIIRGLSNFYSKYIFEIIIIDDNSSDKTAEVAHSLAKEYKYVKVIKRLPPCGVGRALRDGLNQAKGEYILIMDSDFQHIIPEMRDLFDAIAAGADVAVGSRFSRQSVLLNYPFTKIIANRAFHILVNIFLAKRCRDISNNLKILRREVVENLTIEFDDFAANAETGLKPLLMGYKVKEVPISWANRSMDMGFSSFKIMKTGHNYWRLFFRLISKNNK